YSACARRRTGWAHLHRHSAPALDDPEGRSDPGGTKWQYRAARYPRRVTEPNGHLHGAVPATAFDAGEGTSLIHPSFSHRATLARVAEAEPDDDVVLLVFAALCMFPDYRSRSGRASSGTG